MISALQVSSKAFLLLKERICFNRDKTILTELPTLKVYPYMYHKPDDAAEYMYINANRSLYWRMFWLNVRT